MASKIATFTTGVFVLGAGFFLLMALLIEFGVHVVPVWPGQELVLSPFSAKPLRIGLIFAALAVCVHVARTGLGRRKP